MLTRTPYPLLTGAKKKLITRLLNKKSVDIFSLKHNTKITASCLPNSDFILVIDSYLDRYLYSSLNDFILAVFFNKTVYHELSIYMGKKSHNLFDEGKHGNFIKLDKTFTGNVCYSVFKPVLPENFTQHFNLIITGHKQHGKDSVCEQLESKFGLTFKSSSEYANELFIYEALKAKYQYQNEQVCFTERHAHREEWYNMISQYNTPDRAKLGKNLLSKVMVYCGIRNKMELTSLKEQLYIDSTIWVDASERKPPESKKSMTVDIEDADFVLNNNGKENALGYQVHQLYYTHLLPLIIKSISTNNT